MSALKEFTFSFLIIVGWFILIAGIIGLIVSLFAEGMWIFVPLSFISIGLFLIWFYKKFSH
ncbi:hypothetical protein [Fictibacillus sp. BK138]|uniref:hypothetical protein n=1 Tax=Fictibacillus sp. BK138 TaxID=2512121 RepID=UPI0010289692|nr:hypothetical protein [Fictibacillus sp. BK138]RZT21455.1 hypothetical protein EV282_0517 [Fictibacillus sp. BK138]